MARKTTVNHKFEGDRLLAQADHCREQFFAQVEHINHALQNMSDSGGDDGGDGLLELSLQLRLDSLHIIDALLKLNSSFCHAIGIDNRNNQAQNFERLKHALGKEGSSTAVKTLLKLIANIGNAVRLQHQQLSAAREIAKRLRQNYSQAAEPKQSIKPKEKLPEQSKEFCHDMPYTKIHSVALLFNHALQAEAYFHLSIEQLTEALQHYSGLSQDALVLDEIAALDDPINQFFIAAQHDFARLETIFLHTEKNVDALKLQHNLEKKLEQHIDSLQQTQKESLHLFVGIQNVLQQHPAHSAKNEFFHQPAKTEVSDTFMDDLEHHAYLARTMPFYRP